MTIFHELTIDICYFADWLERTLLETKPTPKLVTVVNPGNPSGTYIPEPLLKVFVQSLYCANIKMIFFPFYSVAINKEVCTVALW